MTTVGYRLLATFVVAVAISCGAAEVKDPYKPLFVGEDPTGPGLSPTGDSDGDGGDDPSLGSDKSDAKTDAWFKMRKCAKQCVQTWNARSDQGAQPAIERDCEHRCKRQWFTCTAAITQAMKLMREDNRRRDILKREGDRAVRADGMRTCQRRRWLLNTMGCMIKAKSMRGFDDCEDQDRERRRRLRRKRKR